MSKTLLLAYVALLHLALALCFVEGSSLSWLHRHVLGHQHQREEFTAYYKKMLQYHLRMDGNVADDSVIFIGDSLTQSLCVSAVANPAVNYGIGHDTTVGVLERLPQYSSLARASVIVIEIGTNDITRRRDEETMANFERIGRSLPAGIPAVFSAILPVNDTTRVDLRGRNARARELNAYLRRYCQLSDRFVFVDAGPALMDQDGRLSARFHDGDGIHLNADGNAVWIAALRRGIVEAKEKAAKRGALPIVPVAG